MNILTTYRRFDLQNDQETKSEVPRALKIQKRRFLCGLGKNEPCSSEEEMLVKKCYEVLNPLGPFTGLHLEPTGSKVWTDSTAHEAIKGILKKFEKFELDFYLDCVKAIYISYSGHIVSGFYDALAYVLTHARNFGDQSQNMFQLQPSTIDPRTKVSINITLFDDLPDNEYMNEVALLINDLKIEYDEIKFRKLNNNVTYLILLLLRRHVKTPRKFLESLEGMKIHQEYRRLCPDPIARRLPIIGKHFNIHLPTKRLQTSAYLAIHAYLTVNDEKSKLILQRTCIAYFKWNGLQLPDLFIRVAHTYRVTEAQLWDDLCFDITYPSLFKLADDYYKRFEMSMSDPPKDAFWFPYCRILEESYHSHLSAQENLHICMIMAYMIDLKFGFEKSCVRVAHWARNCVFKDAALEEATLIYAKYF